MLARDGPLGNGSVLVALGVLAERIDTLAQDKNAVADESWSVAGPAVLRCLDIAEDDAARLASRDYGDGKLTSEGRHTKYAGDPAPMLN